MTQQSQQGQHPSSTFPFHSFIRTLSYPSKMPRYPFQHTVPHLNICIYEVCLPRMCFHHRFKYNISGHGVCPQCPYCPCYKWQKLCNSSNMPVQYCLTCALSTVVMLVRPRAVLIKRKSDANWPCPYVTKINLPFPSIKINGIGNVQLPVGRDVLARRIQFCVHFHPFYVWNN